MKIYCACCKKWTLDSTDKFVCGGPYRGDMFRPKPGLKAYGDFFRFNHRTRAGDLVCPLCQQGIVKRNGDLLTEHGTIKPGQATVDTSISLIYTDVERYAWLKSTEYSRELPEKEVSEPQITPEAPEPTEPPPFTPDINGPTWKPDEVVEKTEDPADSPEDEDKSDIKTADTGGWVCMKCGRECKSYAGLMVHMRVHPENTDDD